MLEGKQQGGWSHQPQSGAGDVLPIPGHGDSHAPLAMWGSSCSSEDSNGFNVPSSLDSMLRVLAWGSSSGHREACGPERISLL